MKHAITTVAILTASLAATGCTTALKEGAGLALGAKGSVTSLRGSAAGDTAALAGYDNFELGILTDDMNGQTPREMFDLLGEQFTLALAKKKLPVGGAKTLLARGRVLHYEDSSRAGKALGPVEFVVARIEFVDKATGSVLGVANCVGRTTARVNLGPEKKAQGLARAIVKWIDQRYPKEEGRTEN